MDGIIHPPRKVLRKNGRAKDAVATKCGPRDTSSDGPCGARKRNPSHGSVSAAVPDVPPTMWGCIPEPNVEDTDKSAITEGGSLILVTIGLVGFDGFLGFSYLASLFVNGVMPYNLNQALLQSN